MSECYALKSAICHRDYQLVEYLFDKYFVNNHLFFVPTENYSFIEYNTKTLRVEKHLKIIQSQFINIVCQKIFLFLITYIMNMEIMILEIVKFML